MKITACPLLNVAWTFHMFFKVASNFYNSFLKIVTETLMRKYVPVVLDHHQAAWKIHQSCDGNFKPWTSSGVIIHQF